MKLPDWRTLILNEGVLAEPIAESDRIVLWLRGPRVEGCQSWERISTFARSPITIEDGICTVAAHSIQTRQLSLVGRLLRPFRRASAETTWLLPNGAVTVQNGERQSDVLLVWAENGTIDEEQISMRWPRARIQSLGKSLFAVVGVGSTSAESHPVDAIPDGSPLHMAERLLEAARNQPDGGKLVSALTDLGIVLSTDGKCARAIALLEEALVLARKLGDRNKERDVLGNLGTALASKDPHRARELLLQELQLAQQGGDAFAQKTAFGHLGVFYLRARMPTEAFAALTDACQLARSVQDRQHEAELLWLIAIQHAEVGDRRQSESHAIASIDLLESMGKPQAKVLADHLEKFQTGGVSGKLAPAESDSATVAEQTAASPSWLRMGFSAAKSLAKFVGSGMKRVPHGVYQHRVRTCAACEQHTGLRCKLCGCFTGVKAWLPREECPAKKWPAV